MFNPMGMAIFDIAVAGSYYQKAISQNVGIQLPDQ
jgi:ornithine cyclodeaminase